MSRLLVSGFSISLDGYGAGPRQSTDDPLGVGGENLHDWLVGTRTFKRTHGGVSWVGDAKVGTRPYAFGQRTEVQLDAKRAIARAACQLVQPGQTVLIDGGTTTYYLVATLTFDSMLAIQAGLASPEGQATGADLANFAQAGVELLVFDEQEI